MSTHFDRIDPAKLRVLLAHGFAFDPRRLAFINAARAVIPIEDVEDHDLEWLEKWIAVIDSAPRQTQRQEARAEARRSRAWRGLVAAGRWQLT
jgi:hypothetical protein